MNIFITGATGFIGKTLLKKYIETYKSEQHQIILLSDTAVPGYATIISDDFTISKNDFSSMGITQIDLVIHMGAYIPKHTSDLNNAILNTSNIITTNNLLTNLPNPPKKFVFISTVDVYKQINTAPINENTLEEPSTLYGFSKLYCEKMLKSWADENNVSLNILRLGHIYGKGEGAFKKLIPTIIQHSILNEEIDLHTTGMEKRAFLNVLDCCNFILKVAFDNSPYPQTMNIASEQIYSVSSIIDIVLENNSNKLKVNKRSPALLANDLFFDNTLRMQHLGEEQISFKDGIKEEYYYFKMCLKE